MPGEVWLPGSFTKNFSWGHDQGLLSLYENIRIGFNGQVAAVPRDTYRKRVKNAGRPDYIPINFFLFNAVRNGVSHLLVDELVFQALTAPHSSRFDKLALFAFNFSYAGVWNRANRHQRYPALWARNYILERVARKFEWNTERVDAADIEEFLRQAPQFHADTYTKVSTNLNFLYKIGDLAGFSVQRIERWWVDALFLALDRLRADLEVDGSPISLDALPGLLLKSKFRELTGPVTLEKTFAMAHLLSLYSICGGAKRFEPAAVREQIAIVLPDYHWHQPNDDRPEGALHPTNPRIVKTIPRDCAKLAEHVGFQIISADDLESLDPEAFIRTRAADAVDSLSREGIKPIMTAEEVHKLVRGE